MKILSANIFDWIIFVEVWSHIFMAGISVFIILSIKEMFLMK